MVRETVDLGTSLCITVGLLSGRHRDFTSFLLWEASNSQTASCLCLLNAGNKGMPTTFSLILKTCTSLVIFEVCLILFYAWFAYIYVYVPYACSTYRSQRGSWNPLGLKLQIVGSLQVCARKPKPGLLYEQLVFLTTKPSLQCSILNVLRIKA